MKKRHLRWFFLLSLFFSTTVFSFENKTIRVIDLSGEAQFLSPTSRDWQPLSKEDILSKNCHVRTGPQSSVQLAMDEAFGGVVRIEENTDTIIQSERPLRVLLVRGKLFFSLDERLLESDLPVRVKTPDILVAARSAGFSVEVSDEMTAVSAFEEQVDILFPSGFFRRIAPVTVDEGFKWSSALEAKAPLYTRMSYEDYVPWQVWIRKVYEWRDDFASEELKNAG